MDGWKAQTLDTIHRIRSIFALDPHMTESTQHRLWGQARMMTEAMKVPEAKFWSVFVNTLRILVATRMNVTPTEAIFETTIPNPLTTRIRRPGPSARRL